MKSSLKKEKVQAGQFSVRDIANMFFPNPTLSEKAAISYRGEEAWESVSYFELRRNSASFSQALSSVGSKAFSRICILSESRAEWLYAFFGSLAHRAIPVPLDIKLTSHELAQIIRDAEPDVVVCSQAYQAKAIEALELAGVSSVLLGIDIEKRSDPPETAVADDPVDMDSVAVIIYTSGTTGRPKGVMISYRSLLFQTEVLAAKMKVRSTDVFLSICPLNHLFELTCSILTTLRAGGEVCFCSSLIPDDIFQAMRERRVTRMTAVPLFLRLVKRAIQVSLDRKPLLKRSIIDVLMFLSRQVGIPSVRRFLFRELRRKVGPKFREFISGGAALDVEVAKFFETLGIAVYQGYGMTEAGPVITFNNQSHNRVGSVGKALPGTELKILSPDEQEEGEILVRGPHLMNGYFGQPELTRDSIDQEGWLHSGDLGRIDEAGFLYITGRLKSTIVLSGGKKVQPEEVEQCISQSRLIRELCLVALEEENRSVGLVLVVEPEEDIRNHDDLEELYDMIEEDVELWSESLAEFKRPRELVVSLRDLPRSSTRKVKRDQLLELLRQQGVQKWLK